ncbi:6-carboxytetrahydropterin synthase [Salinarchaeum sp. IM2453]|uniref:6-pyruvoyl trahydropterin synthase family protein n=1 Tax=Salinarchaeum sp. IM2453 TaxID=2862870 RepID=UPI001C82DE84|nr:6-carboxytetrahydropterin synthase [Salinarchaeum sp. IM2453]QZA88356.1 6-carboxytetrahydropterin synthase [Salinarchaeum sp. IM2453]
MTRPDTDIAYPHQLSVTRKFIAQHRLIVPNPEPPEGEVHSHRFTVAVRFFGQTLNEYGYLVDITAVEAIIDRLEQRYRDALLNNLPEFEGKNPSVERFARVFADKVDEDLTAETPDVIEVRIWEDETAWGSYQKELTTDER